MATDISTIETVIAMSDIDEIDSIKDMVEELGRQGALITRRLGSAEKSLKDIVEKLK